MKPSRALLVLASLLAACGRTFLDPTPAEPMPPDASVAAVPARTTLDPPPGPFNGEITVLVTTDRPATVFYVLGGDDPKTSPDVQAKESPFSLTFAETTTLGLYSRTPEGALEDVHSVVYVRAGGPKGTVSGILVVGGTALGHEAGIAADLQSETLGKLTSKGELPFQVTGLATGTHRLVGWADTNEDGRFSPFSDLTGSPYGFALDLDDPFKASLEDVRLYVGTSQPGLCTIKGTVSFPKPVPQQNLAVAALDPSGFTPGGGGGGVDPQTLLAAFANGYRVTTNATDTKYPYEILDLQPGQYLPVPALLGSGLGLSANLLLELSTRRSCEADTTVTADFSFGQVALEGTIAYTPASPAFFAYGTVVARNLRFSMGGIGAQVVLMPALLLTDGTALTGTFSAVALKDDQLFDVRAFTNLDASAAGNPVADALSWAFNPFSPLKPQATFTAKPPSQTVALTAP